MPFESKDKILVLASLLQQVAQWRLKNKKIVFTNGCFDILHYGHVLYLEQARKLGDCLIVALNSDSSVKVLKGENRPINPIHARAQVIASLWFVDAVVVFEEQTPLALIQALKPNILVKGGDYTIDTIVGSEFVLQNGGRVEVLPFTEGYSTTNILNQLN